MEIISPGIMPKKKPIWPIGYRFECAFCGCEFRVEEGDLFSVTTERRPNGKREVTVDCPTCRKRLTFTATDVHGWQ